jgi:hypothetical protein
MDAGKYTFGQKLGSNRQSYPAQLCSMHEASTSRFVTESTILDFFHGKGRDSPESDRQLRFSHFDFPLHNLYLLQSFTSFPMV